MADVLDDLCRGGGSRQAARDRGVRAISESGLQGVVALLSSWHIPGLYVWLLQPIQHRRFVPDRWYHRVQYATFDSEHAENTQKVHHRHGS